MEKLSINVARYFEFDNFKFDFVFDFGMASLLYVGAKARRGDKLAIELLNSLNVNIYDKDGNLYWPLTDANQ